MHLPLFATTWEKGGISLISPTECWLSVPLFQDQLRLWPCVSWPAFLSIYRKRDWHGMEVYTLEEAQAYLRLLWGHPPYRHISRARTLLFHILTLLHQGWNSGTLPRYSWALRRCWILVLDFIVYYENSIFILFPEFEIPFLWRSFTLPKPRPCPMPPSGYLVHSHVREEVLLVFFFFSLTKVCCTKGLSQVWKIMKLDQVYCPCVYSLLKF